MYATETATRSATWLQVVSHLDPKFGGIAAGIVPLCRATNAPVAAFCGPEGHWDGAGLHVSRFARGRLSRPDGFRELVRAADGVHIHGIWEGHCAAAARTARKCSKPYLVSAHGMLEAWARRSKWLKKAAYSLLVERRNLRGAACLRALTRAEVDDYRRYGLKNPVAVVPNGVALPESKGPELFRQSHPELAGRRLALFLGRLHFKKGLDLLCRAWAGLDRRFEDAHLVIAGPDFSNTRRAIEALAGELDLSVTFTGMLAGEMKWSALAAADLFVLPSRSEGFSVAVLEALGAGVPALITRQCNFPEIEAAGCGWIVEPNAGQLRRALETALLLSRDELAWMGRRGAELVRRRYSWPAVGRQMSQLYDWVLGGPLPRDVELF